MRLAYVPAGTTISISELMDGAVTEYNKTAAEDVQIKVKDRILSVGDVVGDAGKMVAALKEGETLELTIARLTL